MEEKIERNYLKEKIKKIEETRERISTREIGGVCFDELIEYIEFLEDIRTEYIELVNKIAKHL